jgi:hypothetical protein
MILCMSVPSGSSQLSTIKYTIVHHCDTIVGTRRRFVCHRCNTIWIVLKKLISKTISNNRTS